MDANSRKKPSQLEINDLIAEAVVNAEARRNQAEELLSDEELAVVKGGVTLTSIKGPFILGVLPFSQVRINLSNYQFQQKF
jgi:hypothetical protein